MTKVISLSDMAYENLFALKRGKESFSDVVLKITKEKQPKPLIEFAGKWKGDKEETERIFKEIIMERTKATLRDFEL
ncbi:MAG: antitoxin VapB family protein [Candidatus Altiarchaeota archaeon]|nr:antitoxin VapB family protein [Candidatus Altiarchaeota archaeon]